MFNRFRAEGIHKQVKNILKRDDMAVEEVQQIINHHCSVTENNEMILAQLVTLKHFGKVE